MNWKVTTVGLMGAYVSSVTRDRGFTLGAFILIAIIFAIIFTLGRLLKDKD